MPLFERLFHIFAFILTLSCSRLTDFGKKTVQVHRTRLKDDLVQLFSCPEITRQVLNVRVIDDHGRLEEGEGPGVLRDVLSTFWQHIFASLTLGYVEKVPSIRHDHWACVAVWFKRNRLCARMPISSIPGILPTRRGDDYRGRPSSVI